MVDDKRGLSEYKPALNFIVILCTATTSDLCLARISLTTMTNIPLGYTEVCFMHVRKRVISRSLSAFVPTAVDPAIVYR